MLNPKPTLARFFPIQAVRDASSVVRKLVADRSQEVSFFEKVIGHSPLFLLA